MRKILSLLICAVLCFNCMAVMAAIETAEWVQAYSESFTDYAAGTEVSGIDNEYGTWTKLKVQSGNADLMTYTVADGDSSAETNDNALAIYMPKLTNKSDTEDRRLYYFLKNSVSTKLEISFRVMKTDANSDFRFEVFGEMEEGSDYPAAYAASFRYSSGKARTGYNTSSALSLDGEKTNTVAWTANQWMNVKFTIDYSYDAANSITAEYTPEGAAATTRVLAASECYLPASIGSVDFRVGRNTVADGTVYVDDFVINEYKVTVTEDTVDKEFEFSQISSENINGVSASLNLINEYTDSEGNLWYVDWVSGDNAVIDSETGNVSGGALDQRVELTAIFTSSGNGGETEVTHKKVFNVNVLAAGTYYMKESFDKDGDYSGLNAISSYIGQDGGTWGVGTNYKDTATQTIAYMNANIGQDPDNQSDKVLRLKRTAAEASPKVQRVWTEINQDATQLNKKVYASMRIYREASNTPTQIYAYDANGVRLFYFEAKTDNAVQFYYGSDLKTSKTVSDILPSGKWFDMTIEMDMETRCYCVYIDGNLISGNMMSFAAGERAGFGGLMFDLARTVYNADSTIYFDDLTVRTIDNNIYSVIEYNFVDSDGYRTHSMEQGGMLKSIKLRKMSMNETEPETRLFVGYYKDNVLNGVYTADIQTGLPVGSFEQEINAPVPDNPLEYTVRAFVWEKESLMPVMQNSEYIPFEVNPTVYVAGDSIAKSYAATEYPQTGYAQVLNEYLTEDVAVANFAEGGRSSKSFIDEGRLDSIFDKMRSGDYLLIQFGHNDPKTTDGRYTDPSGDKYTEGSFKYYLMKYIDGARQRGAVPILVTPPARCEFDFDGKLYDAALLEYVTPMRDLAGEENVLIADLYDGWKSFVDNADASVEPENYYMYLFPGDERFTNDTAYGASKYNPDNIASDSYFNQLYAHYYDNDTSNIVHADGTHFNAYSARVAAQIVARSIKNMGLAISDYIINETDTVSWPWGMYQTFGETVHGR